MGRNASRTVVITGATRGLGRAMVEEFATREHTVIGCGRSKGAIAELQNTLAGPHRFDVVDVTSDTAVGEWAAAVLKSYGAPDLLLNNAALINRNAKLWEVPAEEFSQVIDANIKGVTNVIRHFVPAMVAKRAGIIVNFSSGWGRSTDAEHSAESGHHRHRYVAQLFWRIGLLIPEPRRVGETCGAVFVETHAPGQRPIVDGQLVGAGVQTQSPLVWRDEEIPDGAGTP